MTREQIEDLEQSGVYIEQMFHTLASIESSTYKDFLLEIAESESLKKLNDKFTEEEIEEFYSQRELPELLCDYGMYGFIAEVRIPKRSNFRFDDDGNFLSCSVSHGIMSVEYCFSETIDGLVIKVINIGNEHREKQENKAKLEC